MDCQKSPRELSPAQPISPPKHDSLLDDPMAAVVAPSAFNGPPSDPRNASAASSGVGKTRYRPAPAKTFQCRGYGECRMVFSRSEHLARHIRYVPPPFPSHPPPFSPLSRTLRVFSPLPNRPRPDARDAHRHPYSSQKAYRREAIHLPLL